MWSEVDTAQLPIYATVAAGQTGPTPRNGLPVRPRADPALARQDPPPPMVTVRDPARVSATVAAYARGVSQSRASHPRP